MPKYAVLFRTSDKNVWYRDGNRFDTEAEANSYGRSLWHRWSSVREWQVVLMVEESNQQQQAA